MFVNPNCTRVFVAETKLNIVFAATPPKEGRKHSTYSPVRRF